MAKGSQLGGFTLLGLLLAGLSACAPANDAGPLPDPATYRPAPGDVLSVPDIGDLGLWMITKDLKTATWLGEKYQGKTMHEPINVVLLDKAAATPEQATERMLNAMNQAGYGPKNMHSVGYYGYLNGNLMSQYPKGKSDAFSDGPWYTANNHGRIFGPFKTAGGYVFTGAFSRENFVLLPKPSHTFNSFQVAREDLAERLTANTVFKRSAYLDLKSVIDTPTDTTGDHDGRAVLLVAN